MIVYLCMMENMEPRNGIKLADIAGWYFLKVFMFCSPATNGFELS